MTLENKILIGTLIAIGSFAWLSWEAVLFAATFLFGAVMALDAAGKMKKREDEKARSKFAEKIQKNLSELGIESTIVNQPSETDFGSGAEVVNLAGDPYEVECEFELEEKDEPTKH